MNGADVVNFAKYTFVGIMGLIWDMILLYVFVEFLKIPVLLASGMSFFVSIVHNFFWHKYWTFHDNSAHFERQFLSFFIICIFNMAITLACMYLFVDIAHIWYMFSKVLTSIIVLAFSYTANRIFTFKLRTKPSGKK